MKLVQLDIKLNFLSNCQFIAQLPVLAEKSFPKIFLICTHPCHYKNQVNVPAKAFWVEFTSYNLLHTNFGQEAAWFWPLAKRILTNDISKIHPCHLCTQKTSQSVS